MQSATVTATEMDGFLMATEPPVAAGGSGQYPPATRMVIAALLNCTFSSLKAFCDKRDIPTDDLRMDFTGNYDEGVYKDMAFLVTLPKDFPEKYRDGLDRVFATCAVKKIMKNLPEIEVKLQ